MDTFYDHQLAQLIEQEEHRQYTTLNLIASENYAPAAIRAISGSVLTNKYAEGTPGKRFYSGCRIIDEIETLAITRCKKLFECEYANVQAHSGAQANMAAYCAFLKPGDTVLSMDFSAGGHISHGYSANLSSQLYKFTFYTVDPETERIDYQKVDSLAQQHRPKLIIAGASSYSRIIDFEKFSAIARSINAFLLTDIAHIAGLVAAKIHPSPVPFADCVTGTLHKTLRGPRGGFILCKEAYGHLVDRATMPGIQGGPLMQQIAAKALCFELALHDEFKKYQQQLVSNTATLACELQSRGYRIVSGGTDNHLFVIDLTEKGITGVEAERTLEKAGILATRSSIPFETKRPMICSGIRLGAAAVSTRGVGDAEMLIIANYIDEALKKKSDDTSLALLKDEVAAFLEQFPVE
ncbi:MAG: Serine hydroxymethyltransferase [candidate division TM6 bacterium GW2011_GWE2_42_60]|nr:MAG: Serine hydroxymethyltransferase [candidate division TM6 bacterium GW2011_GWE2_42_60]HBY05340.1 serine hydroxymethyltransferase [Candidatus Dependentiae bacterium]